MRKAGNGGTSGLDPRSLGIADNADFGYTSFGGQSAGADAILIRYTLVGDADLTGDVGLADLLRLCNHLGYPTGQVWHDGDFDYDGGVDSSDYDAMVANMNNVL